MKLYKVLQLFLGKDLSESVPTYYVIGNSDEDVYNWINKNIFGADRDFDAWADMYDDPDKKKEIMLNKGDFNEEYMGEFYDIKYGWEEVGEISPTEIETFKRFNLIS